MECLWYGDDEGSLFKYEDISKNRVLKHAIYPTNQYKLQDKRFKIPDLLPNERRILSADVALLASKKQNNDAASIFINSAIPTSSNKYIGNIIYTENHEGLLTSELALIIRRYFHMYHCTDLVLDVKGLGIGVYDALAGEIYDSDLGITYEPLSCCNDPVYAERCKDKSAPKVIWAIQATSQFNNDMYLALRQGFQERQINLLASEFEVEELLKDAKGYDSLPMESKVAMQLPYIHTTLLINELINLQFEAKGAMIRVFEKSGMRKDRVSSLGYNFYIMTQLSNKLKPKSSTPTTLFEFRKPKLLSTR